MKPLLTFPFAEPSTVGSQRLSRESIKRNTASCASNRSSRTLTSLFVCSSEPGGIG